MPAWLIVTLFLFLGFILLITELFIIPGFGFIGIAGFVLICLGAYTSFKDLSVIIGLAVSVGSFVLVIFFIRFFAAGASRLFSLNNRQEKEKGFTSSGDYGAFMGKKGKAWTDLRPSGTALIEGRRMSVLSEGGFVDKDSEIKVVKVEGSRVFVRKIDG